MSVLEYETKERPAALLKFDAGSGTGTALFSRYFVEDTDHDYTTDTFLPSGITVPILIAHQWSDIPVGKGTIRSTTEAAYVDFTLADTARGKELAAWLRFDMADNQPKSQWSYGFSVLEGGSSRQVIEGKSLRVLHARPDGSPGCTVHECSYTLRGAGIGTALVAMKSMERYRWDRRHRELTAQIETRHRAEQAEVRALHAQFMARQQEMTR